MRKFFIQFHQILGTILSLVFLMWFLSGFVMIYSGFPHANKKKAFKNLANLSQFKTQISMPDTSVKPAKLILEIVNNKAVYAMDKITFDASNFQQKKNIEDAVLDSMVVNRYKSTIEKEEILNDFDAWIPWSHFKGYFPIHKYYLADSAATEVYVAGTTGKVVQETTSKTRWFARFGAIPHWFYFKSLRLKRDLWADFIIWLSGIGALLSISGLIVGLYSSRKWRKLKNRGVFGFSPYKKKWFRWHHIVGMIFGVFVFTFVFSGMLSLMDIPQWIVPVDNKISYSENWKGKELEIDAFKLPISKVLDDERFKDVKQIRFNQINGTPYYLLYKKYREPIFVAANNADTIISKVFTYNDLVDLAKKTLNNYKYKIEQLTEFDNYYNPRDNIVSKITIDDDNNTALYIKALNPTIVQYMNSNRRVSRWLYNALHTFSFPGLHKIEWLRKTLLIVVSIFGVIVSLTGVVLGFNYLRRLNRKRKRKRQRKLKLK